DIVTVAYAGILALRDRHVLAIVTPHHDAPGGATGIAALADLVAHHAAGDGAAHGCRLEAVALADRVAQQATRHGTNDGAQGAAAATVAVEVNLLHFLHHATVGAAGGAVLAGLPVATIVAATVAVGLAGATSQGQGSCKSSRHCEFAFDHVHAHSPSVGWSAKGCSLSARPEPR